MEPTGLPQADQLYRGFPNFSDWGTLPLPDADLWSRFAASLEERRREASPDALKAAVEVAVRAAALDTGAIEGLYNVDRGFTMTVAMQSLAWEQAVEERGANVRELFEAQLEAYENVLDAATQAKPISEAWIRTLHQVLCAPQKTYRVLTDMGWQEQDLSQGQYKTRPNHVLLTDGTLHAYAPVDRVSSEMHRLLEQMRTPEFEAAHPVLQASYCHYAFVVIHPFADGNGRVARALASTFFYRAQSIPLVIFDNQRPAYLDSLRAADRGDFRSFVSFFLDRGIDTMQLVSESLITAGAPRPEELAKRIKDSASQGWSSLSEAELRSISDRILLRIGYSYEERTRLLGSSQITGHAAQSFRALEDPQNYAYRSFSEVMSLFLRSETLQLARQESIIASVAHATSPSPFPIVIRADRNGDQLEARLADVYPELTPHFLLRLDQWIERQLGHMLSEIAKNARPEGAESE